MGYLIQKIDSMAQLRGFFEEKTDYRLNWLVASTSGVHGSYTSLDDWEAWRPTEDEPEPPQVTVLVIQPRRVQLWYGCIDIEAEDVPWLRETIRLSLLGMARSQEGNATVLA